MTDQKTELRVSTWLAVIAEMARGQQVEPNLGNTPEVAIGRFFDQIEVYRLLTAPPIGQPDTRRALIRIAALSMRLLDEYYPGDGLEF